MGLKEFFDMSSAVEFGVRNAESSSRRSASVNASLGELHRKLDIALDGLKKSGEEEKADREELFRRISEIEERLDRLERLFGSVNDLPD